MFSDCGPSVPSIANGRIYRRNLPFYRGRTVEYECRQGFSSSDPRSLINACIVNQSSSNGVAWRYSTIDLLNVCQPGNFIIYRVVAYCIFPIFLDYA